MPREALVAPLALAILLALPAAAQPGPPERSPGEPSPAATAAPPERAPEPKAKQVAPKGPLPRGAVLEEIAGTVVELDGAKHRLVVDTGGERVTLRLDRNSLVYGPRGLTTVLDVTPGAQVRAARNADFLAYWIQLRTPSRSAQPTTPGQGTGPGGGSGAPAEGGAAAPASPGTSVGPGSTAPGGPGAGVGGSPAGG